MFPSDALENDEKVQIVEVMLEKIALKHHSDNYARFVKTPKFEELLVDIGSYDASVASVVNEDDLTMLIQDGEGLAQAHLSA